MVNFLDFLGDVTVACTLNGLPDPTSDEHFERALLRFFREVDRNRTRNDGAMALAEKLTIALGDGVGDCFFPCQVLKTFLGLDGLSPIQAAADPAYRKVVRYMLRNGWYAGSFYLAGSAKRMVRGYRTTAYLMYVAENALNDDGSPRLNLMPIKKG